MKYMIIAGEASGDLHASCLIRALRKEDPEAELRFFGGDLMSAAAGHGPDLHYDKLNVMGFVEVLKHLPSIFRNLKLAKRIVKEWRPDVLILVDFPGFNLKLAAYASKIGVRVDYYISPKLWAWKEWRIKSLRKNVTHLYSILPFEVDFYRRRGFDRLTYVGNPSVEEIDHLLGHISPLKHFLERQGIRDTRPIIALLPGSRLEEIRSNLPLMIEASKKYPDFQYVVAAASSIPEKYYREVAQDPGLKVAFGGTQTLVKYSKAALVTSGTATLETALLGTPQVVCYRANGKRWTYRLMEALLKVKYVSLPNLIAGNAIVPELLLHRCTVANINRELTPLLQPSPKRDWQLTGYKTIRRKLGTSDAAEYAAELIVDSLRKENTGVGSEKTAAQKAREERRRDEERQRNRRRRQRPPLPLQDEQTPRQRPRSERPERPEGEQRPRQQRPERRPRMEGEGQPRRPQRRPRTEDGENQQRQRRRPANNPSVEKPVDTPAAQKPVDTAAAENSGNGGNRRRCRNNGRPAAGRSAGDNRAANNNSSQRGATERVATERVREKRGTDRKTNANRATDNKANSNNGNKD